MSSESRSGDGGRTLVVPFDEKQVLPDREAVFDHQGIPAGSEVPDHITALHEEAMSLFERSVRPVGIVRQITLEDFGEVLNGDGLNAGDVLVAGIYPQAVHLELFAATMGQEVSARIESLFAENEFALGSMLDSVASRAADMASGALEERCRAELADEGRISSNDFVLAYSPGYCGWHISGQRALFDRLGPERIGITLNESCLMTPLKSVSGVLIAGPAEIHRFAPGFSYCPYCRDRSCLERMERLVAGKATASGKPGT